MGDLAGNNRQRAGMQGLLRYFDGRTFLAAAILLVAACTDPGASCYNCLDHDPDAALPVDAPPVRIIATGRTLPEQASNVYYFEQCAIDCVQMVRFDLPADLVDRALTEIAAKQATRIAPEEVAGLFTSPPSRPKWWVAPDLSNSAGYAVEAANGWPLTYVLSPQGLRTRVFLMSNSM